MPSSLPVSQSCCDACGRWGSEGEGPDPENISIADCACAVVFIDTELLCFRSSEGLLESGADLFGPSSVLVAVDSVCRRNVDCRDPGARVSRIAVPVTCCERTPAYRPPFTFKP